MMERNTPDLILTFQNRARKQAALQALTTLVFVAPHHYVPAVVQEVTATMDPLKLAFIGEFEIGVWSTPEGELYVDGRLLLDSARLTTAS